jgi:hypothetical protein
MRRLIVGGRPLAPSPPSPRRMLVALVTVCSFAALVSLGVVEDGEEVGDVVHEPWRAGCPTSRPTLRPAHLAASARRVLLHSHPGSGNTWLRLLLENATGAARRLPHWGPILKGVKREKPPGPPPPPPPCPSSACKPGIATGSIYHDASLIRLGLEGEGVADGRALVVKHHCGGGLLDPPVPMCGQGFDKVWPAAPSLPPAAATASRAPRVPTRPTCLLFVPGCIPCAGPALRPGKWRGALGGSQPTQARRM